GRLGAHIKRVIGLLYETRQTFTPEQINQNCYVIMLANKAVFDSLMNNAKVYYMRGGSLTRSRLMMSSNLCSKT
ncbi:unnamed protein product, partial [Brassica oleracea]